MTHDVHRTVVVTGASSGIGAAIALQFAEPGVHLVLLGNRNLQGLQQVATAARSHQATVRCLVADLKDPSLFPTLVSSIFEWRGRVDVWCNIAGSDVLTGDARHASFQDKLEWLWQVDVRATMLLSRLASERMAIQKASIGGIPTILNVGWDQAEMGMEGESGQYFSATKSAIMSFSRSLAKSVGPKVRVNCLAPGWIKTSWGHAAPTEWDQRARNESSLGRWGTPQDVAQVAYFLASSQGEFINGQVIAINGGWKHR